MGDSGNNMMGFLGFQQNPNNPFAPPPISGRELLFRTVASALPPPGRMQVPNSVGGRLFGTGARLLGGFSDTVADELARQRLDPMTRQLAIAQGILAPPPPPDMGPELGAVQPISQYGAANQPIREQNVKGQPMMPPPPPNPFAGVSPEMLAASQLFPVLAEGFSPSKQADIQAKQADTAFTTGPRTQLTQQQIAESKVAVQDREQRAGEERRQLEADKVFRQRAQEFQQQNPGATPRDYAGFLAKNQLELGASDKATKPVLDALDTQAQIDYRTQMIGIHKQEQARLAQQHRQTLDRGDANVAKGILAEESRSIQNTIKEYQGRIKAAEAMLSDPLITPDMKAQIQAQIQADKNQLESVERPALRDVQGRLRSLLGTTKAGREVINQRKASQPPPPPPGASAPTPGQRPKTLEEYKKSRGG